MGQVIVKANFEGNLPYNENLAVSARVIVSALTESPGKNGCYMDD